MHSVWNDRDAKPRKAAWIAIGVYDQLADLRLQPADHMVEHGAFVQRYQTLVATAHAGRAAAGQNDAGDVRLRC